MCVMFCVYIFFSLVASSVCNYCLKKEMLVYVLKVIQYHVDFYHIPSISFIFKLGNVIYGAAFHTGDFRVMVLFL